MGSICLIKISFALLLTVSTEALFLHRLDDGTVHYDGYRRQAIPSMLPTLSFNGSTTPAGSVLTYITPSSGAKPIPITQQSQAVTSYAPVYTLCELLPTASSFMRSYNASNSTGPGSVGHSTATCTTVYTKTEAPVCATTLSDLTRKYTISRCDQMLTFSTDHGYRISQPNPTSESTYTSSTDMSVATITPAPSIQTLTSYYMAAWQQLTAGTTPENVTVKVCESGFDGAEQCVLQHEIWRPSLLTSTATSTTTIDISTTIHGPSQVRVGSYVTDIPDTKATFRLSTNMESEYVTHVPTTQMESATITQTGPTSYSTITVQRVSATMPSAHRNSTSTVYITSTSTTLLTSTIYAHSTIAKNSTLTPISNLL